MVQIISIPKNRLKNATHLEFVQNVLERVGKIQIAQRLTAEFVKRYEAFNAAVQTEDRDFRQPVSSTLTKQIAEADLKRDRAWQVFKTVVEAFAGGDYGAQSTAADRLLPICRTYKIDTTAQYDQETGMITQFVQEALKHEPSVSTLALDDVFDDLRTNNNLVRTLLAERDDERALQLPGIIKADRVETDRAYDALVAWLNAVAIVEDNANLNNIIAQINAYINRIRTQALSLPTIGTDTAAEPNDDVTDSDTTPSEGGGSGTGSGGVNRPVEL